MDKYPTEKSAQEEISKYHPVYTEDPNSGTRHRFIVTFKDDEGRMCAGTGTTKEGSARNAIQKRKFLMGFYMKPKD